MSKNSFLFQLEQNWFMIRNKFSMVSLVSKDFQKIPQDTFQTWQYTVLMQYQQAPTAAQLLPISAFYLDFLIEIDVLLHDFLTWLSVTLHVALCPILFGTQCIINLPYILGHSVFINVEEKLLKDVKIWKISLNI